MSSSGCEQHTVPTTNAQPVVSVSSLPINMQNAHNSPELANMTVGQLLGQAQRRISVTHVNSAARLSVNAVAAQRNQGRVGSPHNVSLSHPAGGGGTTISQAQQQLATTSSEQAQINRPVFHSYRFEDGRVSMPTRKLITTIDQQDTYYRIDPAQPNTAIPMSAEAVRNEQKMAHALITADQIRQVAFPHRQTANSEPQADDAQASADGAGAERVTTGKGTLLDRARIDELLQQLDPTTLLDDDVRDALLQLVDDFVEQVLDRSCKLCRHRGSSNLEAKDVSFVLEHYYNMPKVVRGGGLSSVVKTETDMHNVDGASRSADFTAHNQRLALIKKALKKP